MSKTILESLAYDDVLLVPQFSNVLPVDVSLRTMLGSLTFEIPFLSAPMDTVTESNMAIAMAENGGLGIIHKNMTDAQQAAHVRRVAAKKLIVGAAISVSLEQFQRAKILVEAGARVLVVDAAHGHSQGVLQQVTRIKKEFGKRIFLIGGNVATAEGTQALIRAGADAVKVGVGPGSICTTRVISGVGVAQFSAVCACVAAAKKTHTPIIADGGLRYSGDITKALAAGASAIMSGSFFAGTTETPGKIVTINGQKMKVYRGMGSLDAMQKGSKDRYGQSAVTQSKKLVPEGIVGYKQYRGSVVDVLAQLVGGVRSGMGYCGAKNIAVLQRNPHFVRISGAGIAESHPHSLLSIKKTTNYNT